jgi:SAM-dependent methyltransferase
MQLRDSRAPLRLLPSPECASSVLAEAIGKLSTGGLPLTILEAGCGRRWPLDLSGVNYRLVGVDLDADALRHRTEVTRDLDESIVGDLLEIELPESGYDVVFNSFVLEHVAGAERLLDRLVGWVRPGGLLILRIPDGHSVYGLMARTLPFRLHVAYHRFVRRNPSAGKPGHAPYPTYYDPIVSRSGILAYACSHNLEVVEEFATNFHLSAFGPLGGIVMAGLLVVEAISRGSYGAHHQNLGYVIRKA